MSRRTEYLLLGMYGRTHLTFEETCKQIGIAVQTGYNKRSKGEFPIAVYGNPLKASVADVAAYIDKQQAEAKGKKDA